MLLIMRIHDTMRNQLVELDLREPGKVSIYACGPTVYDVPHLGHARTALTYDILKRYLEWQGYETQTTNLGVDRLPKIIVHFHKRRLTEDQDLFVREGDFVLYGETYFEITTLNEPTRIFGQREHMMEISAECIKAREGLFNGAE